ncbi:RidA family protein [Pedobacter sp. AW31-3R]|uniref:RidA family protein n=1 Tax=Pedobacter sp. AW31-3R TaxID=3445781 RepID=UPI003F9F3425
MKNKQLNFVNPAGLFDPTPYGFSHSIALKSPFDLCFIAGQSGGIGEGHVLSADFREQVQGALNNLRIILESHSLSVHNIVKITLLIVGHDQDKLKIWGEEAQKFWEGSSFPTSTLIPVNQLALPGMLFEIDVIAAKLS